MLSIYLFCVIFLCILTYLSSHIVLNESNKQPVVPPSPSSIVYFFATPKIRVSPPHPPSSSCHTTFALQLAPCRDFFSMVSSIFLFLFLQIPHYVEHLPNLKAKLLQISRSVRGGKVAKISSKAKKCTKTIARKKSGGRQLTRN